MRISEALRNYRETKGLTLEEISEKTGIPVSTISGWERGANAPRRGNLTALLDFYGVDMEDFLEDTGQQSNAKIAPPETGLRWVPVVSYAQAGTIAQDYQDMCEQIDEKFESDSRDPNAFAVRIVGDSMEPYASDGDTAIFNPNDEARTGQAALVRLKTGETLFKWFFRKGKFGEQILLGSDNNEYDSILVRVDQIEWAYPLHRLIRQMQTRRIQDFIRAGMDVQGASETLNE
jgi:SOS-response transcriptional repressor LexA